ncbi:MFS transporter [Streptomyces sp. CT34]|uniref:MFS transporter n=1 Tax=Streptomyces sp. CT34 TaxID=1553907 RepID=UPI0005B8F01B|nr:MFS transporter [Streptomyces sp. CT34]
MRSGVGPRHARRPAPTVLRGIYLPRSMDAGDFAMTTYGIPLLVLSTTNSASLTGLAFALEWVPRLGAFVVAGAMVDRHGTTRVLRLASAMRAAVVVAAAGALPQLDRGLPTMVTVMLLAVLTGVLTEFSYIAAETAGGVASRQAGTRAHRVQSVLLGIDQVGTLVGPAVAGLLLERTGAAGMLATIAVFSLLACVFAPRQCTAQQPKAPEPVLAGLRIGWTTLRSAPALGWLVCGLTLSNLAIGLLQAATPVMVVRQFDHSSADVGLIWSVAAVASLLAVAVCRRAIDRWGLWPVGALCAALAGSACLAVSLTHTYTAYLVLIAVLMAGEGGMTVVLRTLRSHLIPQSVFGATLSLTILLLLVPFPLAGVLVATVPPALLGYAMTGCAVVQALGLCLAFVRLRTLPDLRVRLA